MKEFEKQTEKSHTQKIKEFFHVPDPSEVDALKEELPEKLTEQLLADYYAAKEASKLAEEKCDSLRAAVLAACGQERGLICRGSYAVDLRDRMGSPRTDWKAVAIDLCGEQAVGELLTEHAEKYIKPGNASTVVEVKRLSH